MRTLGLDLGDRRIGIALSDPEGRFAFPEGFVENLGLEKSVSALCSLIREREVGRAVVGLPLHMDGRAGEGADKARRFAARLGEKAGIPVALLDERWTTRQAEGVLRQEKPRSSKQARKRREQVDAVAASIILRTYLETQPNLETQQDLEARQDLEPRDDPE